MDRFFKPWLPSTTPTSYILINVNVIDTINGTVLRNATPYNPVSEIVDLQGKYLCPGLIDAHVHITASPGEKDLRPSFMVHEHLILYRTTYVCRDILSRGFTTVRDTGGASLALKESIEDGLIPGPRLQIAGHALSQTGGHGDFRSSYEHAPPECGCGQVTGLARICDGVPQCLHAARDELRRGADFLKIMGSGGVISPTDGVTQIQFTPEEVRAITSVAKAAGKYVTGHAYTLPRRLFAMPSTTV
ncbi:hypothetical protein MMC12_002104 [Toensbergia leucococca]|nr:hypothetical protein [Toensbergia leucococca]